MSTSTPFNIPSEETQIERNNILYFMAAKMGAVEALTARDIQALVRLNLHKRVPVGEEYVSERETALTVSIGDSTGITAATINEETFIAAVGEAHEGVYEATYDGAVWHKEDGTPILLADYGITVTGTPAEGDHVIVTETAAKIVWQVADHDKCCASDERSVLLTARDIVAYGSISFSMPQLMFYFPNGLPAGTYRFALKNGAYGGGTGQDGSYKFTTTQAIPAGGGMRHSTAGAYQSSSYTKAQILAGTVATYGAQPERVVIESGLTVTEYVDGTDTATDIGISSGHTRADLGDITDLSQANFSERNAYGDNYYPRSLHRQWLNSDGKAVKAGDTAFSHWYTPQSVYDMPPSESVRKMAGLLHGLDPELRAVMGKATIIAAKPTCDCADPAVPEYETLNDYVFLLSITDVYGQTNNSIAEGSQLALWAGTGNAAKIKVDSTGMARYWFLRSCIPSYGNYIRGANTSGALNYSYAHFAGGVVPGLIIKSTIAS